MSIQLIDSHCHPQFTQYDNDREEIIKRALDNGVRMVCVGTDYGTSEKAINLADEYDGIWATVGLHPNDNLSESFDPEEYYKLGQNKKVVAFGEIGLDYYRTPDIEKQNIQKKRFIQQVEVALELNLPLVIHCRNAYSDTIKLLSPFNSKLLPIPGVIHSFTGAWSNAKQFIDLGFYIGLNGIITFSDEYDQMVVNTPLDSILIETDAPFLAPVPNRGKRNEPLYLKYVAGQIAKVKNITVEEVAEITNQNAKRLFKLND